MELGAFSVSLNVKNLEVSKTFYEKLGFQIFGWGRRTELADNEEQRSHNWTIPGYVRKQYFNLQSWLGSERQNA
jgi:hypothetical protein